MLKISTKLAYSVNASSESIMKMIAMTRLSSTCRSNDALFRYRSTTAPTSRSEMIYSLKILKGVSPTPSI